jgi:hypothetical protein
VIRKNSFPTQISAAVGFQESCQVCSILRTPGNDKAAQRVLNVARATAELGRGPSGRSCLPGTAQFRPCRDELSG